MLHIIANTKYPLTAFVMDALQGDASVRILTHDGTRRGWRYSLLKLGESLLPRAVQQSRYFDSAYVQALQDIQPEDSVLIFGVENIKELKILRRLMHARQCAIFTWNPVRDYQQNAFYRQLHIRALKGLGMQVYTFDPEDARQHQLTLIPQVFRTMPDALRHQTGTEDIDLFFIGQDKGRLPVLRNILQAAQQAGLKTHFHITPDKGRTYSAEDQQLLTSSYLSYADSMQLAARARCLVEVAQANQTGPTIRSMEALFLGKKLLTTRSNAGNVAWFHPDRVLVAPAELARLAAFLASPTPPVAQAYLDQHDMVHWCRRFMDAR